MSFTCGRPGACGLGLELSGPAEQDVYVGYKQGGVGVAGATRVLPFVKDTTIDGRTAFGIGPAEAGAGQHHTLRILGRNQYFREYSLGRDMFTTGRQRFSIFAPMRSVRDPRQVDSQSVREDTLPAVVAELTYDNSDAAETVTLFFAIDFRVPGSRVLAHGLAAGQVGAALNREIGFAGSASGERRPIMFQRWNVHEGLTLKPSVHELGTTIGIALEVPAGEKGRLKIALGVYRAGIVTSGLEGSYLYSRYYSDLEDVLSTALGRFDELKQLSEKQSAQLAAADVSPAQQFMLAHAVHSYYGSTQLLDVGGLPMWVVNEGEYRMMNTLDLTIDMMFFELQLNPWTVRNVLDQFSTRYRYSDQYGVSFCHDIGHHNTFSPAGNSSYELPGLTGCFSFMTQEQLCNWLLTAATYVATTGDKSWAARHRGLVKQCFESMLRRGPDGVMSEDSNRCDGGAEITTYDSLDTSLGQARGSLYLAVKGWAAYLAVVILRPDLRGDALAAAGRAMARVLRARAADGTFPAILESEGSSARVLAAAEGLVYPAYWALHGQGEARELAASFLKKDAVDLVVALREHSRILLADEANRNIFPDGGLRLSSTSNNSWQSKISLFEYVATELFGFAEEPELCERLARAEKAQVLWQKRGSAPYAFCDQIENGIPVGSRYYPRGVSAILHAPDLLASAAPGVGDEPSLSNE